MEQSRNTLLNVLEKFDYTEEECGMCKHTMKTGGSAGKSTLRSKQACKKLLSVSLGSYKVRYEV